MVDKKKSDTASEEAERPDDSIIEEAQTVDEEPVAEEPILDEATPSDLEVIEDAEVVEEAPDPELAEAEDPEKDAAELPEEAPEGMEVEEMTEPEDPQEVADLETMDGVDGSEQNAETPDAPEPVIEPEPTIEVEPAGEQTPRTIEKETVVVERKGAVVPGFLGGALAAVGMLFAAPYVIPPSYLPINPETQQAIEKQEETISALQEETTSLKAERELLQAEIVALQGQMSETASSSALAGLQSESQEVMASLQDLAAGVASGEALGSVTSMIGALTERITELEKRPIDDSPDPASIAAVEAYGRELAELREAISAQMADADELVKSAAAAAEKAVSEALDASKAAIADAKAAEEEARAKAQRAAQAQALVDIQAALEDGSPYAGVLPLLDGIDIPDALAAAANEGITTLPELHDAYTVAARQALSVSRSEAATDSTAARASTWLQNQLGVRSLAPSEGDDPDAVLSRAEAALAEARLEDAIAELSALPEGGQQVLSEWMATASARAEALAAANELAASLATN